MAAMPPDQGRAARVMETSASKIAVRSGGKSERDEKITQEVQLPPTHSNTHAGSSASSNTLQHARARRVLHSRTLTHTFVSVFVLLSFHVTDSFHFHFVSLSLRFTFTSFHFHFVSLSLRFTSVSRSFHFHFTFVSRK